MRLSRLLPTLLLLAFSGICQADLQVLNGTPQRNNRYYIGADKSFLGQPYNWSGVSDGSATMWATMISPSYFLSAQHIYTNQTSVTFYEGNDSTNLRKSTPTPSPPIPILAICSSESFPPPYQRPITSLIIRSCLRRSNLII